MSEELPEDSDDPNVAAAFDPFDSVLDACSAVMPQRQLKWHYRSEHENLESVQGDERDVLIFSVGYGKDKHGRLTMNFGPLNSSGGERRLNVAVTRARKKVVVVSSIRASDFDLGEVRAEGVRVLHRYLDFAERGEDALEITIGKGEFESPLEQSVAAVIRSLGFGAVPQVGCSSFRVDLGVVDPAHLGVECDGASYHSSATARDRDRIRQQILEKLGWKIHRIWSPDWVTRRETEVQRLKAAIEAGQNQKERRISVGTSLLPNRVVTNDPPAVIEKVLPQTNDKWTIPEWVVKYRVCRPRVPIVHGLRFHDPDALPVLKRMLSQIVEGEGPIHKDVAATRLAKVWELDRVGDRMMHAVKSAWRSLSREGRLKIQGSFLLPSTPAFHLTVRQPDPSENDSRRSIEEISSEEIALAMKNLVRDSLSIERESLLLHVARILGFERAGNHIQRALENTFSELLEAHQLVLLDGRVSLPA